MNAVVVGGGIIGLACAHYLAANSWQVTLIDRDRIGAGCSDGNCGFVCPSHVLPIAEPGAIREAARALLKPNSPFAIKPRLDPALWRWLLRFASRCNHSDMMESGQAIRPLLDSSLALYQELLASRAIDCDWENKGLLFAYRSPEAFRAYAATDRILTEHFQRPATRLDAGALLEREPALRPGLAGGWHYEGDAHLRPEKLLATWRSSLEKAGVAFHENSPMTGLTKNKDRITAVRSDDDEIPADAVVLATGALTPSLSKIIGHPVPIQPGKGYSITMPRPATCPAIPLLFPETRVAATPFRDGYRLGSTMEFAGYDKSLSPRRLRLLVEGARPYLRDTGADADADSLPGAWFGWRPMTPDGIPLIGALPNLENLVLATGHNMLGLSMAPATGKLVAEILSNKDTHLVDPRPYAPTRRI